MFELFEDAAVVHDGDDSAARGQGLKSRLTGSRSSLFEDSRWSLESSRRGYSFMELLDLVNVTRVICKAG